MPYATYTNYDDEEAMPISYRYVEKKEESTCAFCVMLLVFILSYMVLFHMIF